MPRKSFIETRWFSLSGRELCILAGAALVALLSTGIVHVARNVYWHKGMKVEGTVDLAARSARINVNSASIEDLQHLPNVGPKTAAAILDYREAHGSFDSLDELKEVSGIGPATVRDIRPEAMCAPVEDDAKEE